jgi:hypothetical protein
MGLTLVRAALTRKLCTALIQVSTPALANIAATAGVKVIEYETFDFAVAESAKAFERAPISGKLPAA